MLRFFQLFIFVSGLISTVNGAEKTNYMINPVYENNKSPVWTLGDQEVVEWKTDLPVYNVSIWQESPTGDGAISGGNAFAQTNDKYQVSNFTWTVQIYSFDLEYSNKFFFWINPKGPSGFPSAYFNIVRKSSTATATASTLAPSSPPSPTATPDDPETANPTDPQTANPTGQSTGLSTTAKLALGLGLGIGIPILAALGALVWLKARQLKATQLAASVAASHGTGMPQQRGPNMNTGEMHGTDSTGFRSELSQDAGGKPLRTELPDRRYE
ncbi:hypothetical protein N7517_004248 [Penicillium concentricum]|uniref:Mid2 domain-containing protein n=1 Tax=Penicillium concentricum TaxID=293559 RepID=A0A9W9S5W4_9EURO|nr:uncharacterized protein N7517_004248 [Penicillium concentricum]KAJ5372242.1 hypothetical protein N7517_004248 [Penicillium concentricum]